MVEELFRRYPERRTNWPEQNMLGKLSKPEDFRGAAVFLLSPASSYMTGSDLRIGTYSLEPILPIYYHNRVASHASEASSCESDFHNELFMLTP